MIQTEVKFIVRQHLLHLLRCLTGRVVVTILSTVRVQRVMMIHSVCETLSCSVPSYDRQLEVTLQ